MKKIVLSGLMVASLTLAACSSNGDVTVTSKSSEKEIPATTEVSKEKEEPKKESAVGKRSNPVPLNSTATVDTIYFDDDSNQIEGNISITLSNVIRGQEAFDFLIDANQFNDEAPEGKEWLIFDVALKLNSGSEDDAYHTMGHFIAVDSTGAEVAQESYATFANDEGFGFKDLYPGGETVGKVGLLVPAGDDVLVEFNDFDTKVFFSLK